MNGPNRHLQYRRQVYRKRKLRLILIILGIVLALLLIGFLIIGNILNNRMEKGDETDSDTLEMPDPNHPSPSSSLNAYPVALKTEDSSSFLSRIKSLKNKGHTAASVPLNQPNGHLLYRSSLATNLGISAETVSLSGHMTTAEEFGIHISGTFYLSAFSEKDELTRSVILAREAALVAEAILLGVDDVLLIAPDFGAEHLSEFSRFLSTVRELAPDGTLGLTVSADLLASDEATKLMDTLSKELNFFALDATGDESGSSVEAIETKIQGSLYYLLRYQMRVLLSEGDTDSQRAWIEAVERNGISNWQILSKYAQS